MLSKLKKNIGAAMLMLLGLLALTPAGCGEQLDQWIARKQTVDAKVADLDASVKEAQAKAATLPSDSPGKAAAEKALAELNAKLKQAQDISGQIDVVLADLKSGTLSPASTSLLRKIPVVGDYIDLVLIFGGLGYGFMQRAAKQKELAAVFAHWAAEEPAGPSPAMDQARAAVGAS